MDFAPEGHTQLFSSWWEWARRSRVIVGLSPMQWAHGRYDLRRKPSPPQSFLWDRVGGVAWCRTEPLVQWSGLLPNRNKKATSSSSPAMLNLGGGGEGSRDGRWGQRAKEAAFSPHSAFPKFQKMRVLVTSWKDTTERAVRTGTIAISDNQVPRARQGSKHYIHKFI